MIHSSIDWHHSYKNQFNLALWVNKYMHSEQFFLLKLKNIFLHIENILAVYTFLIF